MKHELRQMERQGGGAIVNNASVGALTGNPGLIDTQIARAVVNRDEQAYAELAKHVPIGRAGSPEEIASVVLWLCKSRGELRGRPRPHRGRRDDCAVIRGPSE